MKECKINQQGGKIFLFFLTAIPGFVVSKWLQYIFLPIFLPCPQNYTVPIRCTLTAQCWKGASVNYNAATQETVTHDKTKLLRTCSHTGKHGCLRQMKGGRIQNGSCRVNDHFEKVRGEKIRKKNNKIFPLLF